MYIYIFLTEQFLQRSFVLFSQSALEDLTPSCDLCRSDERWISSDEESNDCDESHFLSHSFWWASRSSGSSVSSFLHPNNDNGATRRVRILLVVLSLLVSELINCG